MRRKEREINEKKLLEQIMEECRVCSVAFSDDKYPYVIPMNFGVLWEEKLPVLYFHGAATGKKIDCMDRDCRVAFCMASEKELKLKTPACGSTMLYASVCGTGCLRRVNDGNEKIKGLTAVMCQYDRTKKDFEFSREAADATQVLRLDVETISGKSNWMRQDNDESD